MDGFGRGLMELNNNIKDAPQLVTVPEAAAMLCVVPRTVWRAIADGELKVVHIRGCTRLYLQDVADYMKRNEQVGCV